MKFYDIKDIDGFFAILDKCKGNVYLETGEGDRLNLKSKLSQYVSFARIAAGDGTIPEMEIKADEAENVKMLMDFCING